MSRKAFVLSWIIAVTGGACGGARSSDTLGESLRSFNDGVRWERFEVAAARVPAAERSQWVADMDERAEDLKVTEYDIVKVDAQGERAATVQVKWSWYKTSEGTLRETHATQTWEKQGKVWILVDTAYMRGYDMPGLADRTPPPSGGASAGGQAASAALP